MDDERICFALTGASSFGSDIYLYLDYLQFDTQMHNERICFVQIGVPVHALPVFKMESQVFSTLYPYFLYPFTAISFTGSIYMTLALTIER